MTSHSMSRCTLLAAAFFAFACSSTPTGDGGFSDGALPADAAMAPGSAPDLGTDGASSPADLAGGDVDGSVSGTYGQDGPEGVSSVSLTVTPTGGASFTVVAWLPSSTTPAPVVVISSGLQQPGAAYAPYAKRLASWGIVALTRDDPGPLTQTPSVVSDLTYEVATWLAAQNGDASSALHGRLDVTRVGLAGHSRGGQVSLLAAEGGLSGKLKGVFGIDPVDSAMSGNPQARTNLATIGVPVAFIGETTDASGTSACAPAADNFQMLYAAASSPAVAITAIGADHTQFEDPASCSFCFLCTAGTAPAATVLSYSMKYLTGFFARELLGDSQVDASLGAAQEVSAGLVTVVSK